MAFLLILIFSSFVLPCALVYGDSPTEQLDQDKLKDILQKTGEYCARVERISLYFICIEEIEEILFSPFRNLEFPARSWKSEKNRYMYDYQLIRKGEIEESRILLKENGKAQNLKGAPLKTKRFNYRNVIFGPIGIFGFEAQDKCQYSIEKETKLWDIPVIVIRAVPAVKGEASSLYGRAWVDKANGSFLKAEWEQESVINYSAMQEFAKANNARAGLKQASEYRYEKNGIRFPSEFSVAEDYYQNRDVGGGRRIITKSLLNVKYKDYKFFIVETETGLKKLSVILDKVVLRPNNYYVTFTEPFGMFFSMNRVKKDSEKGE